MRNLIHYDGAINRTLLFVVFLAAFDGVGEDLRRSTGLEEVARAGVSRVLSYVLDTPTSVGGVKLDRHAQTLELTELRVANPDGFDAASAIWVKKVLVEADLRSLFSRIPVIKLVRAEGARLNIETNLDHGSNMKKLMDNAGRFTSPGILKDLPKKQWRIDKGVLDDCVVEISTRLLTKETETKTFDHIELNLAGEDGQRLMANEALVKGLDSVLDKMGLLSVLDQ